MPLKSWLPLSRRGGLPNEIQREAVRLVDQLESAGWQVDDALDSARSFGNWIVKLARNEVAMELVKDRNQFSIVGLQTTISRRRGFGEPSMISRSFPRLF